MTEPKPGERNNVAIVKVIALVTWLSITTVLGVPGAPFYWLAQWFIDVYGFTQDPLSWWTTLTMQGRIFYVLFPFPWLAIGALWYAIVFRAHRKELIVNGQPEGMVIIVVGEGARRSGHIYDFICAINRFKHIEWWKFPRPISLDSAPPDVTIYYRATILANPFTYPRISCKADQIEWGYRTMWVEGIYRVLIRHPTRPVCEYELLSNDNHYENVRLNFNIFAKKHAEQQEIIIQDNGRMTLGEPGTLKHLASSSVMHFSEDTKKEYLDLMDDDELREYVEGGAPLPQET